MQGAFAGFELFDASMLRVGVAASTFNNEITDGLLASCVETLIRYHVPKDSIDIVRVAGSVELPVALQAMAANAKYECLVAIGAVIRGETPHFDFVAKIASEGILRVMLDHTIPIGFGVITTENIHQAGARLHVGGEAAQAALHAYKSIHHLHSGQS